MKPSFWYWENFITLDKIKLINKNIFKKNLIKQPKELTAHNNNNVSKKNLQCYLIQYGEIKNFISNYVECFINSNKYNFGFDIFSLTDSTILSYNIYDSKIKADYDWHIDISKDLITDFKLTCLINLSEKEFNGGDFILNSGNETNIQKFKNPGSMLMLRSNILHKVTPVISGTRKTLTIFLEGPRLR